MKANTKKIATGLTFLVAGILFLVFGVRYAQSTQADATDPAKPFRPVVVELFTSEGCSSCPPADALLARLDEQQRVGNAEIIALEEHVDYWDQLGWRDPFSATQWTERQQEYANSFGNEGTYTPQMVVDGRTEFVGSSQSKAKSAIVEAAQQPKAEVVLTGLEGNAGKAHIRIAVKMLPGGIHDAQVWLAVTETGLHSNVKAGENSGEDLHHAAVVRSLRKVGDAKAGKDETYSGEQEVRLDSTWKRENLRLAVFVQDAKSRHILGAASVRLKQ
jgi:hypothetical protein